jgi:hypothetical protein
MINTTGVTSGTGIVNPSEAPEFTPVYFGGFIGGGVPAKKPPTYRKSLL